MSFVKAVKGKKPVRLVLSGPSGSGKTFTAHTFAKYLKEHVTNKPTAAIDTEHYRMSIYADKFDFDVDNAEPPFDPRTLIKTIKEAEKAGYGQMVIDSSTHYYSGTGGLLEIVNDAARSKFGGNQYAGWAVGTPIQNELIDTIIRSPLHIIVTTRASTAYIEVEKSNGKKGYEKAGMDMKQREGFEYDFDFALVMDMENNATVSKGMGLVTPGMYLKQPNEKTIELILRSINENSVESSAVPSESQATKLAKQKEQLENLHKVVIDLCGVLSDTDVNKKLVLEVVHKYSNGKNNPAVITNFETLSKLHTELEEMKTNKENKKND